MDGRGRALTALAFSLAIYAVPIVSAHWLGLLGPTVISELGSDRSTSWIAADVALALGAQAALGAVVWLALGWGRLAGAITLILAVIPAVYAVNVAYMVTIPSMFLIEDDTTPDTGDLPVACALPQVWLVPAQAGLTRGIDARGEALVGTGEGQYGILRVPQCAVEPLAIPRLPIAPGIQQVASDGSVLYVAYERGVPNQTFWVLRRGAAQPVQVVPPAGVSTSYPFPLLSNDARWVAWTMRSPDGPVTVQLTPVDGGEPRVIAHDLLQRATLTPVELDMEGGTLTISRNLGTFVALGLDGELRWGPLTVPDLAVQPQTFRYLDGQWLAWDAYVEGRAQASQLVNTWWRWQPYRAVGTRHHRRSAVAVGALRRDQHDDRAEHRLDSRHRAGAANQRRCRGVPQDAAALRAQRGRVPGRAALRLYRHRRIDGDDAGVDAARLGGLQFFSITF